MMVYAALPVFWRGTLINVMRYILGKYPSKNVYLIIRQYIILVYPVHTRNRKSSVMLGVLPFPVVAKLQRKGY